MSIPLSTSQRSWLRRQAHELDPVARVGKQGLTDQLVEAVNRELEAHELIKLRFIDYKDDKKEISAELEQRTNSQRIGIIGHIAILYRQHEDPEKRRYKLPKKKK